MVTGPPEIGTSTLVVLYDPNTGRIVHTHKVDTARNGRHPTEEALEKEASGLLDPSDPGSELAVLHGNTQELNPKFRYGVDLNTKKLIELPPANKANPK